MKFLQWILLLRISHWIKNAILFLPVFFSSRLLTISSKAFIDLLLAAFVFCLASSLIYILNDWKDRVEDKLHPQKSLRPIAAGTISVKAALLVGAVLLTLVAALSYSLPAPIQISILLYLLLNILYCFFLKNIAILDVTSISLGFVIRLFAGALATGVPLTGWFVILIFLLMFSIALAKRRDDLLLSEKGATLMRQSQAGYSLIYIDIAKSISFSVTLVAYIISTVSEGVVQRMGSPYVYVTSLPVFLGILRYLQLSIVYKRSGSPVELLFRDKFLFVTVLVWLLLFTYILYA
jgi:decaprenyl-phosphate phosphoribosyltransferase